MSGTKLLKNDGWRPLVRIFLAIFLISPYLIWVLNVGVWSFPEVQDWLPALVASVIQALFSSALAFALGFLMFSGLQWWKTGRLRKWAEISLLFPNVLPPLFFVMSLMGLASPIGGLPYGLVTVVMAHALLNAGLVAMALDRLIQFKIGGLAETAWVLGARPRLFWKKVAWPYLRSDLATIYLFVFSLCFASFSIPLMLSGQHPSSLEVAIYDSIRVDGRWDKALILALMQMFFLLALAWSFPQSSWPQRPARRNLGFLSWSLVRSLPFLPAGLIVLGWAQGLSKALKAPMPVFPEGLLMEALITTAIISLATGLLHLVLFLTVALVMPHKRLGRFLNGYMAPSSTITGFGLLLVPIDGDIVNLVKLVVAISLISFPLLYRWLGHAALSSLEKQIAIARVLGAGWWKILFEVIWPQAAPQLLTASGIAALWAAGDFALSGLLLGQGQSLPLVIDGLLSNYQLEAAQILLLPLGALSLLAYGLFRGASKYVVG